MLPFPGLGVVLLCVPVEVGIEQGLTKLAPKSIQKILKYCTVRKVLTIPEQLNLTLEHAVPPTLLGHALKSESLHGETVL